MVREDGWAIFRQTGSHVIYKKGSVIYPVPYHGAKELGTGLEKEGEKGNGFERQIEMKQIPVIIERSEDGTYCVYCKDEIFSGMGVTINEAKADMHRQIAVYKETA